MSKFAGSDFALASSAITGTALVLHELTSYAVKYGCFATDAGTLSVSWEVVGKSLQITWAEHGLIAISAPVGAGVGTRLTKATVENQFDGSINYDWRTDGLTVAVRAPMTAVANDPAGPQTLADPTRSADLTP